MQPSQPQFEYTTVFRNANPVAAEKMDRRCGAWVI